LTSKKNYIQNSTVTPTHRLVRKQEKGEDDVGAFEKEMKRVRRKEREQEHLQKERQKQSSRRGEESRG
jgi:hypothetical protein